jgi:3-isopropylmalate/(R)-2-methylmalate dehydratase small subunit
MGTARKFGDDVNTDYIIASKRKRDTVDAKRLSRFLMEDIRPGFGEVVRPGDYLVAGENFGCGSAMEIAPLVVLGAGVEAVLAKSFSRTFFRNAVNLGLLLVTCDTDRIEEGDEIEVDKMTGVVRNLTRGSEIPSEPLASLMRRIVDAGGIIPFLESPEGQKLRSL